MNDETTAWKSCVIPKAEILHGKLVVAGLANHSQELRDVMGAYIAVIEGQEASSADLARNWQWAKNMMLDKDDYTEHNKALDEYVGLFLAVIIPDLAVLGEAITCYVETAW